MMKAVRTCETLVNLYQCIRRYNPEDSHLQKWHSYTVVTALLFRLFHFLLDVLSLSTSSSHFVDCNLRCDKAAGGNRVPEKRTASIFGVEHLVILFSFFSFLTSFSSFAFWRILHASTVRNSNGQILRRPRRDEYAKYPKHGRCMNIDTPIYRHCTSGDLAVHRCYDTTVWSRGLDPDAKTKKTCENSKVVTSKRKVDRTPVQWIGGGFKLVFLIIRAHGNTFTHTYC
jgi:hypothetical protein